MNDNTNKKDFYVYAWIREDNNTIFYVGKGYGSRRYNVSSRSQEFNDIYNSVNTHSKIIMDNLTEQEALDFEESYIQKLLSEDYCFGPNENNKYLVNKTLGGDGSRFGHKITPFSEERKENISKGLKKLYAENPEKRQRLIDLNKNKGPVSDETREKMRNARIGIKTSEETKEKLRQITLNSSEETKKLRKDRTAEVVGSTVYCPELDMFWASQRDAETELRAMGIQISRKTISNRCLKEYPKNNYGKTMINGIETELHWYYRKEDVPTTTERVDGDE